MSTIKSFVKETLALIQGDEAGVIAEKNFRSSSKAFNSQLSSLESKLDDQENELDNLKETLKETRFPKTLITDKTVYAKAVVSAYNAVLSKEEDIADTKKTIAIITKIANEHSEDVAN